MIEAPYVGSRAGWGSLWIRVMPIIERIDRERN
jgi:hypothetical protein